MRQQAEAPALPSWPGVMRTVAARLRWVDGQVVCRRYGPESTWFSIPCARTALAHPCRSLPRRALLVGLAGRRPAALRHESLAARSVNVATPPEYRQADDEREGLTLRDYLGVMWRRKWIIILVTVVATVAAFGFSYRQAKVYEAQADLIYEQQLDVANPLTGQSYTDPTQRTHGAQLGQRHHPEPHHHQPRHHGSGGQGAAHERLRGPCRGGSGPDRRPARSRPTSSR